MDCKVSKIKQSKFINKLKTVQSLLYCIWWPSQPDYVKIGYGNIHRPSSSSYTTPFGSNGKLRVWIPDIPLSTNSMFPIEQQLHKWIKSNYSENSECGKEVYNIQFETACAYITRYIKKEIQSDFQTFETTISEYKKLSKQYQARDYIIISSEELLDIEMKCDHCHKPLRDKAYRCLAYISGEPSETTVLILGSTCIKNYRQNTICMKEITENEPETKDEIKQQNIDDFVDTCIFNSKSLMKKEGKNQTENQYICNSESGNEDEIEDNIEDDIPKDVLSYHKEKICRYITKCIFKDFFDKDNKKFNINIDCNFIETHNLSCINFITIYGLISNCKYFELSDLTETGFAITIIHYAYDKESISNYFKQYRNRQILPCPNITKLEHKLTDKQLEYLTNDVPYILGFAGSGKSRIMKAIMNYIPLRILYLTPTYQALDSGLNDVILRDTIKVRVIDSVYMNKEMILPSILEFEPQIILVDEFAMMNIFHLYKLKRICEQFNPILKMFGDPYQLPPIRFPDESQHIIKTISEHSNRLEDILRQNEPIVNNYLSINRSNINPEVEYFNKTVYNETEIIRHYSDEPDGINHEYKGYRFLAYTNQTVNDINSWIFKYKKRTSCNRCLLSIQIGKRRFCDNCIHQFVFIFDNNLKCNSKAGEEIMRYQDGNILDNYKNETNIFYNGQAVRIERNGNEMFNETLSETFNIFKVGNKSKVLLRKEHLSSLSLKLYYAQTIHKSQGQSIDKVFIVIDKREIESSAIYTAITRAKNYSKLKIAKALDYYIVIPNRFDSIGQFGTLTEDFDIEEQYNKVILRLKDGIDIDNYRNICNICKIHREPKSSRNFVIRNKIAENIQILKKHKNNGYIQN